MKINALTTTLNTKYSTLSDVRCNKTRNNIFSSKLLSAKNQCSRDIFFCASTYSIDVYGNYNKYSSRKEASEKSGISLASVNSCARGDTFCVKGYSFADAGDVEKVIKGGEVIVDEKKINEIVAKLNDICSLYVIYPDLSYKKYYSVEQAEEEIGLSKLAIKKHLQEGSNVKAKGGYAIVCPGEVETKDSNGRRFVDLDKIKKAAPLVPEPFYEIDGAGNYEKFSSVAEIVKARGITKSQVQNIYNCLEGRRETTNGHVFVRASKIEDKKTKEPLKRCIDYYSAKCAKLPNGFYLVDANGDYKKYSNQKEISDELNVAYGSVSQALNKGYTLKGRLVVRAQNIEEKDSQGNVKVSLDKIIQIRKTIQAKAVYIIDKHGNYKRFNNLKEAFMAKTLYINKNEKFRTKNGFYSVYADTVETLNDKGEFVLNEDKLLEMFKQYRTRAIYVIDEQGRATRYNRKSLALNVSDDVVYNPKSGCKPKQGCAMAYADALESVDENGKYYLDKEKLNRFLAQNKQD